MACDHCGYSACYSYHSCPRCNPKKPDHAANLQQAKAQQAAIDSIFESIVRFILALFLNPYLCFVGFYLICTGLLLFLLGSVLETVLSLDMNNPPTWYFILALGIPVVLAIVFRKFIRPLMKWILIVGISLLVLWGGVELVIFLLNRE